MDVKVGYLDEIRLATEVLGDVRLTVEGFVEVWFVVEKIGSVKLAIGS